MTEKEKARVLFEKYYKITNTVALGDSPKAYDQAKQLAIITVEEILDATGGDIVGQYFDDTYWIEVIREIEII